MEEYTQCKSFWHVGDRLVDQQIASNAGFTFFWPDQVPDIGFVNEVFTDGSFASSKQKNYKELFSDPEALGRLAMQALSKERKQEDISKYDEYASSGRVDGDDLGNVLPI